jgi:hypothetical protein
MPLSPAMLLIEILCLGIVAVYLLLARRRLQDPSAYLRRFLVLAAASWAAEDSCIRLYGFYAYSPEWYPFLDRVPLLIVLIWPVVILSAAELARHLLHEGRGAELALAGGALVLGDASFIEPISVQAGLWSWSEPGFLGVPPIGVCGWALFASASLSVFAWNDRTPARASGLDLVAIAIAPIATHAGLLALWWGGLRWLSSPIPDQAAAIVAWLAALILTALSLRARARRRIPVGAMTSRIPAAVFFLALLAIHGRRSPALVAYALAFNPPYLSLTNWRAVLGRH